MEDSFYASSANTCDPCRTVFEKHGEASVGFCVNCVEYLCQSCVNHHQRLKATRGHSVLTGESIPDNKAAFEMLEVIGKCPKHTDEEIAYECKNHEEFLCIQCVRNHHLRCTQLIEIALTDLSDTDKSKLSATLAKVESNEEKLNDLEEQKKKTTEAISKERNEILDKQNDLKRKLEKAMLDLHNQEKHVQSSFDSKLSEIDVDLLRLQKLRDRNKLYREFSQAIIQYGRPNQIYMAVNGHFRHIDDELKCLETASDAMATGNDIKVVKDVRDDILNLLLTVDISNHFYENTSDSIEDTQEKETTEHVADLATTLCESCRAKTSSPRPKSPRQKEKVYQNFMHREVNLTSTHSMACADDPKPCDVVGIAVLTDNIVAVLDFANTKLKNFDPDFTLVNQKSLHSRPVGICSLTDNQAAVLLVDKKVGIYRITRDDIKQERSIALESFGHSITTYGLQIAVMCSDSKFDGKTCHIGLPVVEIIDPENGNTLKKISSFSYRPPRDAQEVIFRNPCQIYSRQGTEIIIGTDQGIKTFDSDGAQRWYFGRDRVSFRGTTGITSDTDNNLYICGYDSGNIYQIFSLDYSSSKKIVSPIQRPWAITYDKSEERLLVVCRKSDSLVVYNFD